MTQVRNGESPVATIVDGVLQFSGIQFRQELFDTESIEVVKGPQGAIYGRNATGGAILINTKKPTQECSGYVAVGAGNGDEYSVEGSYSGGLSASGDLCLLYTSPSPRDRTRSRMPSSA